MLMMKIQIFNNFHKIGKIQKSIQKLREKHTTAINWPK